MRDSLDNLLGALHEIRGTRSHALPVQKHGFGRKPRATAITQRNDVNRQIGPADRPPIVDLAAQYLLEFHKGYRTDGIARVHRKGNPGFDFRKDATTRSSGADIMARSALPPSRATIPAPAVLAVMLNLCPASLSILSW